MSDGLKEISIRENAVELKFDIANGCHEPPHALEVEFGFCPIGKKELVHSDCHLAVIERNGQEDLEPMFFFEFSIDMLEVFRDSLSKLIERKKKDMRGHE